MMTQKQLTPEDLSTLILDVLNTSGNFSLLEKAKLPFKMSWKGKEFYVYIKNLSSAYFKDRLDTTRAQLAIKECFNKIKDSTSTFLFFGYDSENDVLVTWNPYLAKARLNERKSVSFYSNAKTQKAVKSGQFLRLKLKNNDSPVLFKREDLVLFFDNIDSFYPQPESYPPKVSGKITFIEDPKLLKKLKPLLKPDAPRPLAAIQVAQQFYGSTPDMTFKDWVSLIKSLSF